MSLLPAACQRRDVSFFLKIKLLSEAETAGKKRSLGLIAEAWTASPGGVGNICRGVREESGKEHFC